MADTVRVVWPRHVFGVGFVQNHPDVARRLAQKPRERGVVHPGAGGIGRIGDVDDARVVVDGGGEALQIMPPRRRGDALHNAPCALNRKRIDHEGVFVHHAVRPGRDRHPGGEFQHVVGAVAERDLRARHSQARRQRLLEPKTAAVRIARQIIHRRRQSLANPRPGAARILVAGELDRVLDAAFPRQFLHRLAGLIGVQRGDGRIDVGQRGHGLARG